MADSCAIVAFCPRGSLAYSLICSVSGASKLLMKPWLTANPVCKVVTVFAMEKELVKLCAL